MRCTKLFFILFSVLSFSLLTPGRAQYNQTLTPEAAPRHDTVKSAGIYKPTGYLSFTVGAGLPLGKYRDSGFAAIGLNLSLSGAALLKNKNFGDAFQIDYGFNLLNQTQLQSALQASLNNILHNPDITCTASSSGNLTYKTLFLGFYSTYPHEKFSFDFKALVGVMFATIPAINISVFDTGRLILTESQPQAVASSFAFSIGGGVRYRIIPGLNAMGYFNFIYSKPQFLVTVFGQSNNGNLQPIPGSVNQVFELANLSIGLAWTPPKSSGKPAMAQYHESLQPVQQNRNTIPAKQDSLKISPQNAAVLPATEADNYKPTGYIAISGGRSWPFKNYRDSGFAMPGINIAVSGAYPFNKSNFGGAFRIDYINNPVDQTGFINALENTLASTTHLPYLTYKVNSLGNYSDETLLVGLNAALPDIRFCFDFRILIGFIFEKTPVVNVSVYNNGNSYETIAALSVTSPIFGYNFGGGLRYYITPKISAIVSFDYVISSLKFLLSPLNIGGSSGGLVQTVTNNGNGAQPIASGNLTLGVAWTIHNR